MSTFLKQFLSNKKRVAEEQAAKLNAESEAKRIAEDKKAVAAKKRAEKKLAEEKAAKEVAPKKTVKKATTKR